MVRCNPGVPYIHTQEFLNPRSMPTPAVAAALVSLISGALFKLSVDMALSLLVLSFFIGVIVFTSKEFCSMRRWARGFFYILNSLIIFAMATAFHSSLEQDDLSGKLPLLQTVHAEEGIKEGLTAHRPEQRRPFFHDWTRSTRAQTIPGRPDDTITITKTQDLGIIRSWLASVGAIVPKYELSATIDPDLIEGEIESVTWRLPRSDFERPGSKGRGVPPISTSMNSRSRRWALISNFRFWLGSELNCRQTSNGRVSLRFT